MDIGTDRTQPGEAIMAKVVSKNLLDRKLAKLENAQKLGLLESGMLVSQRATQKAPIDTGRLKRSIHPTIPQNVGYGVQVTAVGTNVEYAPDQEFGTKFMKAQPYLIPALNESKDDVARLIYNPIVKAMK